MGKPFHERTLFSFLPAAVIFIICAILLNSCGQRNPAGSQTGANPAAASPGNAAAAANIPLALTNPPVKVTLTNASGTATASGAAVTITWDSYSGATSYNLYWANTPDFSDTTKISGVGSPYAFKLPDSRKDYYFFLTGIINSVELRISGDAISLGKNGNRYNLIIPFERLYNLLKKNGGQINALNNPLVPSAYLYDKYPVGPLQAKVTTQSPPLYLGILRQQAQPDGSYIQEWMATAVLSGTMPPEVVSASAKWRYTLNPFTAQYLGPADLGQFTNTSDINITYINSKPLPGSYFIGASGPFLEPIKLEVTIRGQVLPTYIGGIYGDLEAIFTLVAAQSSISLTPASATAYLHPTPTHPQFRATDSNNNDATNTAQWSVHPTGYATVAAGLITPLKPGEANVIADLNGITSDPATLEVMCRQYLNYLQDQNPWGPTAMGYYASTDVPTHSFTYIGCRLTDYTNIAATAPFNLGITPLIANATFKSTTTPVAYRYIKDQTTKKGADLPAESINYLSNFSIIYDLLDSQDTTISATGFRGTPYQISIIDNALTKCYHVIVGISGNYNGHNIRHHYLLVTGKDQNGNYLVQDPYSGFSITSLPPYTPIYAHLIYLDLN